MALGGHDAGDVAAQKVVHALARLCADIEPLTMKAVEQCVQQASADIHQAMRERGQFGGCTVAGLLIEADRAHIFWVGDSRVYRFHAGRLKLLTRDHSVVQELLDAGLLDATQAARHPQANVITRAVGIAETLAIEIATVPIMGGETFLVCSDGVSSELSEAQIERHLINDRHAPANAIMRSVLDAGARDNLTLIDVR